MLNKYLLAKVFLIGIRLKLSVITFLILTRVITILTFYGLVKNNNYVLTVLTFSLSCNFHVLVLKI